MIALALKLIDLVLTWIIGLIF